VFRNSAIREITGHDESDLELPVPVHVPGEELCACGVIPDLSRKISVIRSRNISMSCVFQNLAGLQNRYPLNQWQEILGNCDVTLFLGCTDALTTDFISQRTGEASISNARNGRPVWPAVSCLRKERFFYEAYPFFQMPRYAARPGGADGGSGRPRRREQRQAQAYRRHNA